MKKIRLLIVEDHRALAENLAEYLGEERYQLDFAADGLTGLHLATTNDYDVIVLDVMLPGIGGFELCRRLREDLASNVPIIMLTAKGALEDKEAGFSCGADDYLVKPFDLRELELRIQALHRRRAAPRAGVLEAGDIRYDPGTLEVRLADGQRLALAGSAASIFELLMRAYPNYVPHERMAWQLWGDHGGDLHTLRTHVYALRKNLKEAFGRSLIRSLRGRGYRLDPEAED